MPLNTTQQLLCPKLDPSIARYALIDASATDRIDTDLHNWLLDSDTFKHTLFTGEKTLTLGHVAPYLIQLDNQPEIEKLLMARGWGQGAGIFLNARTDAQSLCAHFRKFFQVKAENGRDVYFRFYDPVILREFLPLLSTEEAMAFFGPVVRFVVEDAQGAPLVFSRPEGRATENPTPTQILFGAEKRKHFLSQWNTSLFEQHVEKFAALGLAAEPDLANLSLTLKDKSGYTARLQKTDRGVAVTTGEGRIFNYALSLCKNPIQVTDPAGNVIHFDIQERRNPPEPWPDNHPDPDDDKGPGATLLHAIRMESPQKTWTFDYDRRNHLKRIDYPDGTHNLLHHDAYGHMTDIKDRNGHTTRLERDLEERLTRLTDVNGHTTQFSYEDLTAPSAITFADGRTFNFTYTDAGELESFLAGNTLVARYHKDAETGTWQVDYTDGTQAEFQIKDDKVIRATNDAGTVELTYDEAGRLLSETFGGRTVTYHRNATGQLTGITTPFGETLQYQRDREGRVCGIQAWSGEEVQIRYALSGVLESITYPNGTCLDQHSTTEGLPAELRLSRSKGRKTIFHKTFQRDLMNRVTSVCDGEKRVDYTYDREGRLLRAASTLSELTEQFSIDAKANRLADDFTRYRLNAADRIETAGQQSFEYDALGNMTRSAGPNGGAYYDYSALNRLKSVDGGRPGRRAKYLYDAFGRRVAKQVDGNLTRFIWAGSQLLHEIQWDTQDSAKPAAVTDYLFFPQTPVLLAMRRDRQTFWAAFGHRYEVLCLTATDGRPVWQAEYDAFGRAHIEKGAELHQPFRLAGQYYDSESGLHYNQARYYDPNLGRYLSLDPLFLEGGSDNFYVYCNGDPINHIDPDGEFIFTAILIGAAIGAAIGAVVGAVVGAAIECHRQDKAGEERNYFKAAKAALLGGAIGAVGGAVGGAVEVLAGATTLAGMAGVGFLSGTLGSGAEQCAQAALTGQAIDPLEVTKQALKDGVVGAAIVVGTAGLAGALGFFGRRLKKAASSFMGKRAAMRAEREAELIETATDAATDIAQKPSEEAASASAKNNGKSNEHCVKDPVNPITGEVVLTQTDFTLPGRLPLTWTRQYGSHCTYDGLLGHGWQTPADARLEIDAKGLVFFHDGTPKAAVFEALPTDQQPVMEVADGALLEADEHHYRVRLKSGLTYHFDRNFVADRSPVIQISDPDGHWLQFSRENNALTQICDDSGQCIHVTSQRGRITRMLLNDKPLVTYHYTGGFLVGAEDPMGAHKRFFYENKRLVRHMNKNGVSFIYQYDKNGRCTHTHGQDGIYACDLEYQPLTRSTRMTNIPDGGQTVFHYDKNNLPIKIEHPSGGHTRYTYDAVGRQTQVTDPLGRTTRYDYDAAGNVTQIFRPDNRSIKMVYDDQHRPIQVQDANSRIWEQCFDNQGRLTEKIDPVDGRTQYQYTAQGDLAAVCDPEGHTTRFEWDTNGHLSAVTDPLNRITRYQRNPMGAITAIIDPAGRTTRYTYDEKSRLCEIRSATGICQTFAWDPEDNLLLYTDPNGLQTHFEYGGLNEIHQRINPDGTRVRYQYDAEENLVGVINERGQHFRFQYDPDGRMISQTDYYGNTTRYTYDPAGQLIQSIDPLQRVITYAYDPAGRLRTKTFESDEQEIFNWDGNGNLVAFQSPDALVERIFDAAGNLVAEKSGEFSIEYQHDRNGRITRRTTSHGNSVAYTYDAAGAVTAIQINDQDPVAITRNTLGQITEERFSKFHNRTFGYTDEGLLDRQTINSATGQIERRYEYDDAGNLIAKHDNAKGPWQFTYDPMGRITEALDPEHNVRRLAYDPAGDLLERLPDTGLGAHSARYKNTVYDFDAAGNLSERRNPDHLTRFEWDPQNRLKTARTADDIRIDMTYDALGRRHNKIVNGQRTRFTWDGDTLLSEQIENQPAREFVYYPGTFEPLALIDGDNQIYYYQTDVNGLPQELTRYNGEIVWSATYDEMGRVEQILADQVDQPLRMQGQYYDKELDLCYNRYRYFDPATCSFISQDPLGLIAGENVYAYCPNVWNWVDPLGLECEETETFYRAVSDKELKRINKTNGIVPRRSDYFVTQNKEYTEYLMYRSKPKTRKKYDHLIEFKVKKGTRNSMEAAGARAKDQDQLMEAFEDLPVFDGNEKHVHLKWERGGLNYGLNPKTKDLFSIESFKVIQSK